MSTNDPSVELKITVPNPNPTEEELKAAIIAALNDSEFVSKLHREHTRAHSTSRTVTVTTQEEFR